MAQDIKSLDQLRDAVTASAGAVQGSTSEEARSLQAAVVHEPQRDAQGRAYATGKRKDAVARVWVKPGSGKVTVNGKDMAEYFARPVLQMILRQPFDIAGVANQYDVYATVAGGGLSGQAGAVKHGISKALQLHEPSLRAALKAGDMAGAAAILGRPFAIEGEVIHGDKRGRTIGVPTLNVALGDYVRPAYGVYATRTRLADGRIVDGVASLGVRPMFQLETPLLEVWLLDFEGDLYGQEVETELVAYLRGEGRFDGLEALKAQIDLDAARARDILKR